MQESSYHDSDGFSAEGSNTKLQHHPSVALHLLRAELLAFNYVHILADALFMLRKDLQDLGVELRKSTGPDAAQVNHLLTSNCIPFINAKYLSIYLTWWQLIDKAWISCRSPYPRSPGSALLGNVS